MLPIRLGKDTLKSFFKKFRRVVTAKIDTDSGTIAYFPSDHVKV